MVLRIPLRKLFILPSVAFCAWTYDGANLGRMVNLLVYVSAFGMLLLASVDYQCGDCHAPFVITIISTALVFRISNLKNH